ncbi:MAG: PBP1A family penicillin-binding protein, partial [Vicinamibacteraceae bacterium]|nr:PBP1A family penicillin-binding protein [Vicinamibacteraceae bacterium]
MRFPSHPLLARAGRAAADRLRRWSAGRGRIVAAVVLLLGLAGWATAAAVAWFTWDVTTRLPGRDALSAIGDMAQATTLLDRHDKPVFTIFKEQRIEVPLERVSPHLRKAVIAIEDQRFYDHRGLDLVRIAGAVLANVKSGRRSQGGSTITQQLARQSFLSLDKTLRRKLKEALLAVQLEQQYTKDEILEFYLNKVYFGDGFHGIEAASLGYFGKHAADLDVHEAALIAGLIQSPSAYAPSVNPERALARRQTVLAAMLQDGAIDKTTHERARGRKLELENALRRDEPFGLYFKEQVRRELVDRFGWERVSQGGLRVYTTIDAELQQAAEKAVEEGLVRLETRPGYKYTARKDLPTPDGERAPDYLQAAVVVLDPDSGDVRAMVGGRAFTESRFNRAMQAKRQPGSAFKPFVFAAALENGFTPATVLTRLNDPIYTPQGAWIPEDGHSSAPSMTLRAALRTSSNRAAVRLLDAVGIPTAVKYAKQLEVGDVPSVPSLALGAGEVTLMSMTAAYAAFANRGLVRQPRLVRRVEANDGTLIYGAAGGGHRAVSEVTAFLMANMLQDVINYGTGWRVRGEGFRLPAAGKTGTTNDYFDAWFVGFTPKVVTGVWVGFDKPRTIATGGYASEVAVPIWASVMKAATRGDKPEWIDRPEGVVAVEICRISGKRPSEGCYEVPVTVEGEAIEGGGGVTGPHTELRSMVYTEYFARGTVPSETCDLHPTRSFFDRIAGAFGKDTEPAPIPASDAVGPPAVSKPGKAADAPRAAPADAAKADEATAEEPPKKKRGFWSRLFGRGGDDDDDKKKA